MIVNFQKKIDLGYFMRFISSLGDSEWYPVVLYFLFLQDMIDNTDILILLLGQCVLVVLKIIFSRPRPYNKNKKINNLSNKDLRDYSFPSGHTFMAFLISKILLKKCENNIIKLIPILMAISRVYLGVHYPSDVLFAAVLSNIFYYFIQGFF